MRGTFRETEVRAAMPAASPFAKINWPVPAA